MEITTRLDVKTRWLLLAAGALVVYSVVPVRRGMEFDLNAISTWLQALMFMLSFPLGSLFMLAVYGLSGGFEGFGIIEHFQTWAVALALGFVQWFYLVPALVGLRRAVPVVLNLSADTTSAPAHHAPGVAGRPPRTVQEADGPEESDAPPVPQFDERGRTPVERLLGDDGPH